jgi:hypothetical protein
MDLFEYADHHQALTTRPSAEIVRFPVDRELKLIRETARVLQVKHGPAADRFWQVTCRRLYARLQVQGLPETEIKAEVDRFAYAVHDEMRRIAWLQWSNDNPRGAA